MYLRVFQPSENEIEIFSILSEGSIKARGVKENQTAVSEFRMPRNGIDDYRQRFFGKRALCAVPDWRDSIAQSDVNELGTVRLND